MMLAVYSRTHLNYLHSNGSIDHSGSFAKDWDMNNTLPLRCVVGDEFGAYIVKERNYEI
jgi:hypothetical protein